MYVFGDKSVALVHWKKWSGVLCDRQKSMKPKRNIYRVLLGKASIAIGVRCRDMGSKEKPRHETGCE